MLKSVFNAKNVSNIYLDGLKPDDSISYLLPSAIIHLFYVFLAVGVIANCYLIFLIVRVTYFKYVSGNKVDDVFIVLFFIAFCDICTSIAVAPFEVSVLNYGCSFSGLWILSSNLCRFFLGMEALFNTEMVYLLAILGLTVISKMGKFNSVTKKAVTFPIALSWALACSLSVPLLIRGQTISPRTGLTLCTVVDHWELIPGLFLIFRTVVPCILLLSAAIFISVRLCDIKVENYSYPRVILILSTVYGLFSLHRSVFTMLYVLLPGDFRKGPEAFKYPPLANVANSHLATLIFSMIHYSVSVLRPIFVYFSMKGLWKWKHSSVPTHDRGSEMQVVSYNSEEILL